MDLRELFHKYNTELRKLNRDLGLKTASFVYTIVDDNRLYGKIGVYNYKHPDDKAFTADFFNKVLFIYPDKQFSDICDLIQEFLLTLKKFLLNLQE